MNSVYPICASCGRKNRVPAAKQHLSPRCGHCREPLELSRWAAPVDLEGHELDSFLSTASRPVLLEFFSPACGYCLQMAPVVDRLARTYFGRLIIARIDTTRSPSIATRHRIGGTPAFFFYRDGRQIGRLDGAIPEPDLIRAVTRYFPFLA